MRALKLDIKKLYDRLEWDFLAKVMIKFDLILRCIIASSFSVLINGVPSGNIIPKRGLRQGCPPLPLSIYFMCQSFFMFITKYY